MDSSILHQSTHISIEAVLTHYSKVFSVEGSVLTARVCVTPPGAHTVVLIKLENVEQMGT